MEEPPYLHETRDLEYGFPARESGIDFSAHNKCSYLEILRYSSATKDGNLGEVVRHQSGELGNEDVVGWIEKVRLTFQNCGFGRGQGWWGPFSRMWWKLEEKEKGSLLGVWDSCEYSVRCFEKWRLLTEKKIRILHFRHREELSSPSLHQRGF